jgi:cell wall-associated NlpC family hydrolase
MLRPAPPPMLRLSNKWIWVGIVALLTPFVIVAGVTVLALGITDSETVQVQESLQPGMVPAAYVGLIEKAATTCSILSAPLLAAQFYQESGFDPNAVSNTGAEGIAQFEPYTWTTWASPNDGDGKENPFNPADEIPAAARFDCALASQLSKVPGDAVGNMLAGYNAGAGAVVSAGGVPHNGQTEGYVKNIEALEKSFAKPTTTTIAASSVAVEAIKFAYDRLGTPYLYGGTGTAAENGEFDCSGLTQAAYASAGVTLPRVAADQWYAGVHIPRDQLQPGDLVFFATNVNDPSTIEHVGIYVGGGAMIDAPHTGAFIRFDPIDGFNPQYIGAVRPYSTVPSWPVATGIASASTSATATASATSSN